MAMRKIRFTLTSQSLSKIVSLVANGALLASNAFMVTAGIRDNLRDNRRQRPECLGLGPYGHLRS